ncbi:Zinc finger, CCCH-type [Cinara cedri]|uniref:Zinc finger, CCCH-type n=1 Tax=Cinara cedri TaxID=506608 RepID=A0A5E4MFV2_9HEMI|nr:Zinc finger, CCCH-type [Cinara cedri]
MFDEAQKTPESENAMLAENDNNRATNEFEDELEEGEIVDDEDDVECTDKVVESTVPNNETQVQYAKNHVREYFESSWEIERGHRRISHNPWSNQGFPEYYDWPRDDDLTVNNNWMKKKASYSLNDDDNLHSHKKLRLGNGGEESDANTDSRYRINMCDGADDRRCSYNRPTVYGKRQTGVVVAPTRNDRTTAEPCKRYHAGMRCYLGSNCRLSHAELGVKQKCLLLESFGQTRRYDAGPSKYRGRREFTNNYFKKNDIPSLLDMKIPIPPELKKTYNDRDTNYRGITQTKSTARPNEKCTVDDSLIVKIRDNEVKNVEEKRMDHIKEDVKPTHTAVCSYEPLIYDYNEWSDEDNSDRLVIDEN